MHAKEANRARAVTTEVGRNANLNVTENEWKLVVTVKGEDIPIALKKEGDRFVATSGNGKRVSLEDNFTLADSVVNAKSDSNTAVVQLINRQADGTLRIRYKGRQRLKMFSNVQIHEITKTLQALPSMSA